MRSARVRFRPTADIQITGQALPLTTRWKRCRLPSSICGCRLAGDGCQGEEMNEGEPGAFSTFLIGILPWVVLTIPLGVVIYRLSKQKGRDSLAATVFAFVPFVNWYLMVYFVGATNRLAETRLEEICERLRPGEE